MASMQQSFKSGQSQGHAQAKTEEWMESGKEAAKQARNKAADAAQSTKESAHEAKQEASGFLQQTGEQMMNMAQGAVDTVKNTLGMNDNNDIKKN